MNSPKSNRKYKLLQTVFYTPEPGQVIRTFIVSTLAHSEKPYYLIAGHGRRVPEEKLLTQKEANLMMMEGGTHG